MTNVFDKFSDNLKQILERAMTLAEKLGQPSVSPLILLCSASSQKGCLAQELLAAHQITPTKFKPFTAAAQSKSQKAAANINFSNESRELIERAALLASKFFHQYVGTEHLLAALLEKPTAEISELFKNGNIDENKLKEELAGVLRATSRLPDMTLLLKQIEQEENQWRGEQKLLDRFSNDLTNGNLQKKINPVIGREKEIELMIQTLCRKDKNNPIILGDPGVGKTALVEGLAKKIAENDVPTVLIGKKIMALNMSAIVAGTTYRGEFEQRLKNIIDEIRKNPDTIIFIDELHTIVGAGSASGSLDAANIFKPLLGRGELRCIGATTLEEYKKHIEPDAALSRRFQSIILQEPTAKETLEILRGIKKNYESFHNVEFSDKALVAAVELSEKFLPGKFWPDKAIDLIDEAASRAQMLAKENNPKLAELAGLKREIENLQSCKNIAVNEENFDEALKLKKKETELNAKIQKLENETKSFTAPKNPIETKDIEHIISQKTGINVAKISAIKNFDATEKRLNEIVIGQNETIAKIAKLLKRHRAGLNDFRRPIASVLISGPSGSGKTFLAQALAETHFNNPKAVIHLNMSEFNDQMSATKLIGAPAGYVGYREGNKLADAIKKNPHSVILFDEIEKAHPEIHNILLQIMDAGEITDANGRLTNFQNCILLFTCNLGSELWDKNAAPIGFSATSGNKKNKKNRDNKEVAEKIDEQIKKHFGAAFTNRLDKILFFNKIDLNGLKKIVKLNIEDLNKKLARKNARLAARASALAWLAIRAERLGQGARGVKKIIEQYVENLLLDEAPDNKNFTLDIDLDKLILKNGD